MYRPSFVAAVIAALIAAPASAQLISTVVGSGVTGFNGDGIPGPLAYVNSVHRVAVDASGNIYIADSGNNRVRFLNISTGFMSTIAGTGTHAYNGDNILAASAQVANPIAVALDQLGNVFIADTDNYRVRKINVSGYISTIAGTGANGYNGDHIPGTSASFEYPCGVAADTHGNVYIADSAICRIMMVNVSTGIIISLGGTGTCGYSGDGAAATSAAMTPTDVFVTTNGNIYFADDASARVRMIASGTGIITTVVGNGAYAYNGDNLPATSAGTSPVAIKLDSNGNMYIADGQNRVRFVAAQTGVLTTIAGGGTYNGVNEYNGDNFPATQATICPANGVAVDSSNNVYIGDLCNQRVRKVSGTPLITTVAGNGNGAFTSDNVVATTSALFGVTKLAFDSRGNLYICDSENNRVRMVNASTGILVTVAGTGTASYNGDNIAAVTATLNSPFGIALDVFGNLFIADSSNQRVRVVNVTTGIIKTVAGSGAVGYNGDHIPATSASSRERLRSRPSESSCATSKRINGEHHECGRHGSDWLQWRWHTGDCCHPLLP